MASVTLYFSIMIGLILSGLFFFPQEYSQTWSLLSDFLENPLVGGIRIFENAFRGSGSIYLLGLITLGTIASIRLASQVFGGGFSLLFAIPLVIIYSLMNIFLLPTSIILNSPLPYELKVFYTMLIGGLTLLTMVTFTSGRN